MGFFARLWQSLTGRAPKAGAVSATPAPSPAARPTPAVTPPERGTPIPGTVATASAPAALKRPLVGPGGNLAGFEWTVTGMAWDALVEAHVVQGAGRATLVSWDQDLPANAAALSSVDGLMVTLGRWPDAPPATWTAWRSAGIKLGVREVPRAQADFVVLSGAASDRAQLVKRVAACRQAAPRCAVVVTDVRNVDDLEAVLAAGATWATGFFDRSPTARNASTMPPQISLLNRLIHALMKDDDLGRISDILRSDVALSYQLLTHVNSPLLGMKRQIEAVDQAVQILGRQLMYRWVSAQMLRAAAGRASSAALQEIALARAAFLESLAPHLVAPGGTLYLTGLFSLLDVMLQRPMAELVEPLGLPPEATLLLTQGQGPWEAALSLVRALEAGDEAQIQALAQGFGGLKAVTQALQKAYTQAAIAMQEQAYA
jgi:c-di-GMP phosphodiesterase